MHANTLLPDSGDTRWTHWRAHLAAGNASITPFHCQPCPADAGLLARLRQPAASHRWDQHQRLGDAYPAQEGYVQVASLPLQAPETFSSLLKTMGTEQFLLTRCSFSSPGWWHQWPNSCTASKERHFYQETHFLLLNASTVVTDIP